MTSDDPRAAIVAAIASDDDDALATAVDAQTHHGRPGVNAATKRWIATELRRRDGAGSAALLATAQRLSRHGCPTLRAVAAVPLADLWPLDREKVLAAGIALACDDDWEVREWAAHIFGAALERDFAGQYPTMLALTAHPHEGVRRAMALAAMDAADRQRPERAEPLLALIEHLLPDRSQYVRKNLGPFALGACLLRTYPDATRAALDRWLTIDDEITRWNIAMACGSAVALRIPDATLPLLAHLLPDEYRLVRSAVRSALRRHARNGSAAAATLLHRLEQ